MSQHFEPTDSATLAGVWETMYHVHAERMHKPQRWIGLGTEQGTAAWILKAEQEGPSKVASTTFRTRGLGWFGPIAAQAGSLPVRMSL